jgi:hypothetical protein
VILTTHLTGRDDCLEVTPEMLVNIKAMIGAGHHPDLAVEAVIGRRPVRTR